MADALPIKGTPAYSAALTAAWDAEKAKEQPAERQSAWTEKQEEAAAVKLQEVRKQAADAVPFAAFIEQSKMRIEGKFEAAPCAAFARVLKSV